MFKRKFYVVPFNIWLHVAQNVFCRDGPCSKDRKPPGCPFPTLKQLRIKKTSLYSKTSNASNKTVQALDARCKWSTQMYEILEFTECHISHTQPSTALRQRLYCLSAREVLQEQIKMRIELSLGYLSSVHGDYRHGHSDYSDEDAKACTRPRYEPVFRITSHFKPCIDYQFPTQSLYRQC